MDPQSQRTADAYRTARLQAQRDQLTAAAQRLANSVPFLPEAGAAWSAGLRSLDDLASGRAADFGQRWNDARAQQRAYADEFQREHPIAGNVLGALGMTAPAALALPASQGAAGVAKARSLQIPTGGPATPTLRGAADYLGRNATAGALAGGAYGFSQPGTLRQRVQNGRNAFLPGAMGGALGPLALSGLGKAALVLGRAPAVAAAISRGLVSSPVARTLDDLGRTAGVDVRASLGDTGPLARDLAAKGGDAWSEVNELPAPITTDKILQEPDVIHTFGSAMNDMEDVDKEPLKEIPVASDYYSPILGNLIPNFLLRLPNVEAVDTTRRQLLQDIWQRYGASGRLEPDAEGEDLLAKAKGLSDLLSEGPDFTGQAYRRAFGSSGDELSLRGAFQSAQGKLLDPSLQPDEYAAWFGALRPFERQAARAAAANDVLRAVDVGRPDVFVSPTVQQRMQTAFGSDSAGQLLRRLDWENLAASLRLPRASGTVPQGAGPNLDARTPTELNATPRYEPPAIPPPTPTLSSALLPSPLAAWVAQQGQ